ncbi:thiamine-phosphate kinase [Granulicella sibirica]|uniref:Thiamine-monophosphate kinase n=1 Tax=Granulicella sibirica TaxID=2479048 RepID=A0A4Q0T1X1_9BACT|nr:thiamine-phosphate kinase [Granulicella sibirica]RXH57583.1 Thiamine-monophosphate kinase [Granulicella sibirica]
MIVPANPAPLSRYPPISMKNGELALIDQIRATFAHRPTPTIPLGIGDDCAILRPPPGHELLVTTDFTLEGRHFRRDLHPAASVGHRCLARGLSDLAAMGATPLAAFLSLALPAGLPTTAKGRRWIASFLEGLHTLAQSAKVTLAGGDTSQSPSDHILADIILIGTAPTGTALRRSTARPGDHIHVTGQLGGSAAELQTLLTGKRIHPTQTSPHFYPTPRLKQGLHLRSQKLATACIDLSDGLSTDLTHLCESSRVRAEIEAAALPIHPKATFNLAVNGGEDYELLFTAAPATRIPKQIAGVPITRVGTIHRASRARPQITVLNPDGTTHPLKAGGWEHFKA